MNQQLHRIYNLGITDTFNPEDKRRAILINQIIFFCGLTPIVMLPLVFIIAEWINVIFISICGLTLIASLLFSSKGHHHIAMLYFICVSSALIATGSVLFQHSGSDIYLIPTATIPFLTSKSKKEALIIFFLALLLFCGINVAYNYIEPIAIFEGAQREIAYINAVVLIACMILVVLFKLKKQNEIFEGEIIKQKELTEEAHKEVLDSIKYAKRIQSAILPPEKLVKEYLQESFILYKPKDIVAGDFYWLEHKEGKILFAAADCTGHGVPGAMVSVVCNNGLNRSVREYGLTNPSHILDKTREIVIQEFEKSEDEVKDGMDIALCALEGNTLQYAGAHNPLWIVRNGEVLETKADKQPIGKFDKQTTYTSHTFELHEGDSIYIFSDGYVDQFGGEKGKKFKSKAFKTLLLSIQDKTMEEQRILIDEAFETWRGNLEQIDDVCVMGVRI